MGMRVWIASRNYTALLNNRVFWDVTLCLRWVVPTILNYSKSYVCGVQLSKNMLAVWIFKHWELLAQWHSVTSQNTWMFSSSTIPQSISKTWGDLCNWCVRFWLPCTSFWKQKKDNKNELFKVVSPRGIFSVYFLQLSIWKNSVGHTNRCFDILKVD
jgi:hypothetical protein